MCEFARRLLQKYNKSADLQVSSYDMIAPPWAYIPDPEFAAQEKLPNLLGEFVWTGFDYLRKPTPYGNRKDWPSRSSYCGIVDLADFRRTATTCIRASGPISRYCNCCRTGTGMDAKGRRFR
jgi:hypothetical protein